MKVCICGDVHWCTYSSILRKRGTRYSLRLENLIDSVNWVIDTAASNGCTDLFFLGDFFDASVLTAEEISALSELKWNNSVYTSFIVGNHEMGTSDLSFSTAHSFLLNKNNSVYDKPSIVRVGDTLIYILPYELEVSRKGSIKDYFPQKSFIDPECKKRILLSHNDIKGIQMGNFISKEGFDLGELSQTFDIVVNGHLHNQQWVSSNVLNLGNITGQNFSEDATRYPHQCMILDCDTLEYTLVNNPYALKFTKLDFTGSNSNIDYINEVAFKLGKPAVLSIRCEDKDYDYIKKRFDPDIEQDALVPKDCRVIQSRIIVDRSNKKISNEEYQKKQNTLHIDYISEFSQYIQSVIGTSDDVITELQKVIE